jgi:hypothetical protein
VAYRTVQGLDRQRFFLPNTFSHWLQTVSNQPQASHGRLLAPKGREYKDENRKDLETSHEHAEGEEHVARLRQVGEVVRGAYLAEAGADVREAGDHRGPGGHQVQAERGHPEGGEHKDSDVEGKEAEDALNHLI